MKAKLILILLLPLYVKAQESIVIEKLLGDTNTVLVDTSILHISDTNQTNRHGQLNGVWRVRSNESQRLVSILTYYKGKRHGSSLGFFPNGKIATSTMHDLDVEIGPALEFWQNGQLRSIRFFKDGKVNGIIKLFDTSGQIIKVFEIKNAQKEGHEIVFYPSGNIQRITMYVNNQENGIRNDYEDKEGYELTSQSEIRNGVIKIKKIFRNGIIIKTETY